MDGPVKAPLAPVTDKPDMGIDNTTFSTTDETALPTYNHGGRPQMIRPVESSRL